MISEEKIWEYLDGGLNEGEHAEVEYAIKHDSDVSLFYQEVSALHALLLTQTPEEPSMSFTENVMRAVLPSFPQASAPKISLLPVMASLIPLSILLILVCAIFWYAPQTLNAFGVSDHLANILKMSFILIDSVLLALFVEQWFYSRKAF